MSANQPSKQSRWQSYVDDALMKTGQVSKAAIHALDGARWASSPDFKVHSCRSIGPRRPVECIRMGWEKLGWPDGRGWDGSSWDGSSLASQPYFSQRKIRLARETRMGEAGMGEDGMGEAGNEGTLTPTLNTLLSLASKSISRGSRMCSTLPP